MFGTTDLALFVVSGLLLNITPGPDTLYILGRTASQGWRGGAVAALGIGAGLFVHTFAAAVGLSALLAASATAFTLVKWAGAAYLVYVGATLLLARPAIREPAPALRATALRTVFLQGFLTNVLNPKVALFFLAFLPQFVDPGASNKALAFLFLGFVFNFNGTLWNLFVAWSAARVVGGLGSPRRFALWLNRTVGALFVYLGFVAIATTAYGESSTPRQYPAVVCTSHSGSPWTVKARGTLTRTKSKNEVIYTLDVAGHSYTWRFVTSPAGNTTIAGPGYLTERLAESQAGPGDRAQRLYVTGEIREFAGPVILSLGIGAKCPAGDPKRWRNPAAP